MSIGTIQQIHPTSEFRLLLRTCGQEANRHKETDSSGSRLLLGTYVMMLSSCHNHVTQDKLQNYLKNGSEVATKHSSVNSVHTRTMLTARRLA